MCAPASSALSPSSACSPPACADRPSPSTQIATVLNAYEGNVKELHLSHNDITNDGARHLLIKDVIQHYPVAVKNGLYQPLWLRLEQCRVNRKLGLPEWMYTPDRNRLKPAQDCPAVQAPHLDLPVPRPEAFRARPRDTRAPLPGSQPPPPLPQQPAPPQKRHSTVSASQDLVTASAQGSHGQHCCCADCMNRRKQLLQQRDSANLRQKEVQQRQEQLRQQQQQQQQQQKLQQQQQLQRQRQQQLQKKQGETADDFAAWNLDVGVSAAPSDDSLDFFSNTARFEAERQAAKRQHEKMKQNVPPHEQQASSTVEPQLSILQPQSDAYSTNSASVGYDSPSTLTPQAGAQPSSFAPFTLAPTSGISGPGSDLVLPGGGSYGGMGFSAFDGGSGFGASGDNPFNSPFAAGPGGFAAGLGFPGNGFTSSGHANPSLPSVPTSSSLLSPFALGQEPSRPFAGGAARASLGMPHNVANSFGMLSLDPNNKDSGHDSPETSTEFNFAVNDDMAQRAKPSVMDIVQRGTGNLVPQPLPREWVQPEAETSDGVGMLKDMFPDVGVDAIRQILYNCGGNLSEAANQLSDRSQRPVNNWSPAPSTNASPHKTWQAAGPRGPGSRGQRELFADWEMGEVQYYIVIGYLGTGWHGFQYNREMETGQGALHKLLFDLNAVRSPIPNEGRTTTFTASRTDKGVHAAGLLIQTPLRQILYGREHEFVDRLNQELQRRGAPHKSMRVFAVKQTPRELLHTRDPLELRDWSCRINSNYLIYSRTYWYVVPTFVLSAKAHGGESKEETIIPLMKKFRLSRQEREHANQVLNAYVRRADFRSFTDPKRLPEYEVQDQGGTEREVYSCKVLDVVQKNGYEFACIEITGDRFMYHQIRLIMGLAFLCIQAELPPDQTIGAILRGAAVPGQSGVIQRIPLAPAEPLLLRELNYRTDGADFAVLADLLASCKVERDKFCDAVVRPHVFEKAPRPVASFVKELHQTGGFIHQINIKNSRR